MDSIDYIAEAQRIWTDILNMDARILPVSEYSSLLVVFAATLERRDRIAELRGREAQAREAMQMRKRVWVPSDQPNHYQEARDGAVPCWWLLEQIAKLATERERLEKESENAWASK